MQKSFGFNDALVVTNGRLSELAENVCLNEREGFGNERVSQDDLCFCAAVQVLAEV